MAVLAAFGSGDYKTAGVVAFFMLMGEIIETRTAEGARASIESLIKLTPTKARRIQADKSEEEVAASQLAVGDVIRVRNLTSNREVYGEVDAERSVRVQF
jgi:Cd2+/Zn2+-exporting ATPase